MISYLFKCIIGNIIYIYMCVCMCAVIYRCHITLYGRLRNPERTYIQGTLYTYLFPENINLL